MTRQNHNFAHDGLPVFFAVGRRPRLPAALRQSCDEAVTLATRFVTYRTKIFFVAARNKRSACLCVAQQRRLMFRRRNKRNLAGKLVRHWTSRQNSGQICPARSKLSATCSRSASTIWRGSHSLTKPTSISHSTPDTTNAHAGDGALVTRMRRLRHWAFSYRKS